MVKLLAMAHAGAQREDDNVAVSVLAFLMDARTREEQLFGAGVVTRTEVGT